MFGALILVAIKGTIDLGNAHNANGISVILNSALETNRIEAPM